MRKPRLLSPMGVIALAPLALFACQSTSDTSTGGSAGNGGSAGAGGSAGSGGAGGATADGGLDPNGNYTPKGCSFVIGARPEYQQWAIGTSDTGATPHIRRVRLGLGGSVAQGSPGHADPSTSAGVAWQTDDGTLASDLAWGDSTDASTWPAAQRVTGVTWLTPPGVINGNGAQRMHETYVCGLTPGRTYYYRVGGGAAGSEQWSDVYAFTTAPADGTTSVKIAVTGDSRGEQQDAWRVLQSRLLGKGVGLQLFSGDMINLAPDQGEWEQWLDNAGTGPDGKASALPQLLTLAAHGNHDNHTSLFFGNLVLPQDPTAFTARFAELFFSVDFGPVHAVIIDDAYLISTPADADYKAAVTEWLQKDLDAADKNRAARPWIVAVHHHPEFSSSAHGKDADVMRGRNFFVPIWDQYHVDMVLNGHDHDYERSKPLTGPADSPVLQSTNTAGTTYVVCAGSGAEGYGAGQNTWTAFSHAYSGTEIGMYGLLTADQHSLTLEAHALTADGSDPVLDQTTLTR